jgi:hypothetical protein
VTLLALLDLQRNFLFIVLVLFILLVVAMDKRSHWPFSVLKIPPSFDKPTPFEIKTFIIKTIYEERFEGKPGQDPIAHLKKFEKRCQIIKLDNVSSEVIKIKMFSYSLGEKALNWFLDFPLGTSHSWLNLKSAFMEIFGLR